MFTPVSYIKKVFVSPLLFTLFIALVCSVAMTGVNALEFFGLRPCAMCKMQRFIVFFIMVSGLSGLLLGGILRSPPIVRTTSYIVCFGVLFSFAFAIYQFGVEKAFFPMPGICSQPSADLNDPSALADLLSKTMPSPPCNKAQRLGPFSIGEYTLIGTGLMFLSCLLFLFMRKKSDKDDMRGFICLDC